MEIERLLQLVDPMPRPGEAEESSVTPLGSIDRDAVGANETLPPVVVLPPVAAALVGVKPVDAETEKDLDLAGDVPDAVAVAESTARLVFVLAFKLLGERGRLWDPDADPGPPERPAADTVVPFSGVPAASLFSLVMALCSKENTMPSSVLAMPLCRGAGEQTLLVPAL